MFDLDVLVFSESQYPVGFARPTGFVYLWRLAYASNNAWERSRAQMAVKEVSRTGE